MTEEEKLRKEERKKVTEMLKQGKGREEIAKAMNTYFKRYCTPKVGFIGAEEVEEEPVISPYDELTTPLL